MFVHEGIFAYFNQYYSLTQDDDDNDDDDMVCIL